MIRLLLPSLMGLLSVIAFIWIAYHLTVKYVLIPVNLSGTDTVKTQNIIKKIATVLTGIIIVGYLFYAANIASVNEIPRSEPDRSAIEHGRKNFEQRMKEDAQKPKQ